MSARSLDRVSTRLHASPANSVISPLSHPHAISPVTRSRRQPDTPQGGCRTAVRASPRWGERTFASMALAEYTLQHSSIGGPVKSLCEGGLIESNYSMGTGLQQAQSQQPSSDSQQIIRKSMQRKGASLFFRKQNTPPTHRWRQSDNYPWLWRPLFRRPSGKLLAWRSRDADAPRTVIIVILGRVRNSSLGPPRMRSAGKRPDRVGSRHRLLARRDPRNDLPYCYLGWKYKWIFWVDFM